MSHHSEQSRASVGVQTDEAPAPVAEYIVPASTLDPAVYIASAPVNEYVASSYVIEYVAPAPVTTLLEPPVPVVQVVQVPHVRIIEKTVEALVTHFGQGSQTPEILGTAPVRPEKHAEIFDVPGLRPPC